MTVMIPDNKGFCLLAAINAMSESDGNNPVYMLVENIFLEADMNLCCLIKSAYRLHTQWKHESFIQWM